MKSRALISIAIRLCASLASFPLAAQEGNYLSSAPRQYTLQVLPGPPGLTGLGNANSINDRGWVTGVSNPPDDSYDHAVLWRDGQPTDLGTLAGEPGYNSTGPGNNRNDRGWVVGTSETLEPDPYLEDFGGFICSSSPCAPHVVKGYLWQSKTKQMIALPPLSGGNNTVGVGANNQEMFGYSENGVKDDTGPGSCVPPQVFDFEGVVWGLGSDGAPFVSRRLSPLAGDTVSFGLGINERGDIVGGGGLCAAFETHAALWKNDGSVIDLGNLGGATNVAIAINNQGQVVGNSVLSDGLTIHAFLWEEGSGMHDLGALPGDVQSTAAAINDSGEVVGNSCDSNNNCRGFHWQRGVMTDLSALPAVSRLVGVTANDINSRGEIPIAAIDPNIDTNVNPSQQIAAVLIPVGRTPAAIPAHSTSPNAEALVSTLVGAKPSTANAAPQFCQAIGAPCAPSHSNCCSGSMCSATKHTCCTKPITGMACTSSAQCCHSICLNSHCL